MSYPKIVYAIQHNVTKKIYIGSGKNVDESYSHHLEKLRKNEHPIEDLQNDYNECGEDFTLFILDKIETQEELVKEYQWKLKFNTIRREVGYNYNDSLVKDITMS